MVFIDIKLQVWNGLFYEDDICFWIWYYSDAWKYAFQIYFLCFEKLAFQDIIVLIIMVIEKAIYR